MAVRNQDWYNLNESRPWPLDDMSSLADRNGLTLPHNLIADLFLRFPSIYGDRACLGAVTLSERLVTLTISAVGSSFVPLAVFSVTRPVEPYVHYELDPQQIGVGGWIVFGKGVNDYLSLQLRFENPTAALFLAQTARRYYRLPVSGFGKLYSDPVLTGLVRLSGGNDMETVSEEREIAGVLVDAAVLRLKNKRTAETDRNVLELYAGDCGHRPESRNCGNPQPIEFINSVTPDCCGNIYVEFRGLCEIEELSASEPGVVVDMDVGLSSVCVTPRRLPDADGKLPNEYPDSCPDHDEDPDDPDSSPSTAAPTVPVYLPKSKTFAPVAGFPLLETFETQRADDFQIISGEWTMVKDGANWVWESDPQRPALALWTGHLPTGWSTVWKRVSAVFEFQSDSSLPGSKHNAALVLNYRPTVEDPLEDEFWLAEVDYETRTLQIVHESYRGRFRYGQIDIRWLRKDQRCRIRADIVPANEDNPQERGAVVSVELTNLSTGQALRISLEGVPGYYPATGWFGLRALQSRTWFDDFKVDNYSP